MRTFVPASGLLHLIFIIPSRLFRANRIISTLFGTKRLASSVLASATSGFLGRLVSCVFCGWISGIITVTIAVSGNACRGEELGIRVLGVELEEVCLPEFDKLESTR